MGGGPIKRLPQKFQVGDRVKVTLGQGKSWMRCGVGLVTGVTVRFAGTEFQRLTYRVLMDAPLFDSGLWLVSACDVSAERTT